jgi:allantoinase
LNAPLLVHAEHPIPIAASQEKSALSAHPREYARYLASRPSSAESWAIASLYRLAVAHGTPDLRLHVVHVACEQGTRLIDRAAKDCRQITGETCPHYLAFAAEDIPDGATQFKCAPPIRNRATREALWDALRDGTLTMVVSDHSPCPPELKLLDTGDFSRAWGGISSLHLGLPVTWTGASARNFWLTDIARWMCDNPAKLAGLNHRKGKIAPGFDADLIFFDPDETWTVRADLLHHRHTLTPYDGMSLRGVVKRTILRGRTIYDASLPNPFPLDPIGQWLKRGT